MDIYAVSDLHLSGKADKPMNVFGEGWEGHFEKIKKDWNEKVKPDDAVLYTLDTSLPVGTRKAGRKKRTGYVVDTYKVYKDADGNVAERQKLWTTTYRAMQDEILYNDGSGAAKE